MVPIPPAPWHRLRAFLATGAAGPSRRPTRPYTRTNGKAERFIQTLLREWASGRSYTSSLERTAALPRWLHYYNWHRGHGSLQGRPPISRVVPADNLLSAHN